MSYFETTRRVNSGVENYENKEEGASVGLCCPETGICLRDAPHVTGGGVAEGEKVLQESWPQLGILYTRVRL